MSTHTLQFLGQQLKTVENSIEVIEVQIASDPPDTSDKLLELRQLQRMYRELAVSLKGAIDLFSNG
jgi:hypothetical protein